MPNDGLPTRGGDLEIEARILQMQHGDEDLHGVVTRGELLPILHQHVLLLREDHQHLRALAAVGIVRDGLVVPVSDVASMSASLERRKNPSGSCWGAIPRRDLKMVRMRCGVLGSWVTDMRSGHMHNLSSTWHPDHENGHVTNDVTCPIGSFELSRRDGGI